MNRPILKVVEDWYRGPYIEPQNNPRSGLVFLMGHHRPHWTAKAAQAVAAFWFAHWQWVIGTSIAVVGLAVALKKLG